MRKAILRSAFVTASALVLAFTPIGAAQAAGATTEVVMSEAASLEPGEFVWHPERAERGEVEVIVSIPLQRAYVYRGGTLIGVTTVSTGRPGHETPVGTFNILQKRPRHFSNLYNNAPMPYMQRLTWGGIALHAGQIPGRPASHGCVRLPLEFSRLLFGVTQMGGAVHIIDFSPSAGQALALVRGYRGYTGMGGPEEPVETAANTTAPAATEPAQTPQPAQPASSGSYAAMSGSAQSLTGSTSWASRWQLSW